MKLSSFVERIGGGGARAWDVHYEGINRQKLGKDVIFLTVGDTDFCTSENIRNVAIQALNDGDTHYTEAAGRSEFRRAIAQRHQQRTNQQISEHNVIVLAGAQCGLFCASMCIAQQGDEIITLDPMFATYEATIRASGANLVRVPHKGGCKFRPDLNAIEQAITQKTRAIFIASPGNPTGTVLSFSELKEIANLAIKHELWVVFDEVYSELVFEGIHTNICSLPGMAERTITVSSLSKSFAMTGWRAGWAVVPDQLIEHFENLALAMLYGLPGFVQQAGIAALEDSAHETKFIHHTFHKRRDIFVAEINKIAGLHCQKPQAGMFALVDIRSSGLSSAQFCEQLLLEQDVAVLDASAFGQHVNGYIRIAYTVEDSVLVNACQRIASFMETIRSRR